MSDVIEGFLVDLAFVDRTQTIHGMLSQDANQICSFTPHGTTFFNTPIKMVDPAAPGARNTAWTATTKTTLVVDTTVFPAITTIFNHLSQAQYSAIFRIIDRLAFKNDPTATAISLDADLTANAALKNVYVPKSCLRSTAFTSTNVVLDNETLQQVAVPNYIQFDVSITAGTQTVTTTLLLYLNCDTFTSSYSKSTIKTVIAPLPYDTLLNSSITSSVGNVFTTASMTANLSYQTQQPDMALNTMSGIATFAVTLVDGTNSQDVPFNLLYKGKFPSISQIRDAIRNAILTSGVGSEDDWRKRAPGLFIVARFYLVPLWDLTVSKPTVTLNQGIIQFKKVMALNQGPLIAAGLDTDFSNQGIFESGYDNLMLLIVPDDGYIPMDQSMVGSKYLVDYFPDFQSCSSVEPVYALLDTNTQNFITRINTILAKASGASSDDTTPVTTEGKLAYYSVTVNDVEMCVLTQACYTALLGASQ